jgi:DtxR family transcriptional regulator, Mn-dependent transcriptional regulator
MAGHLNDSSVWRAFEEGELTHSAAHYLMAIMHLKSDQGYARVTDVAEYLQVSRGAASKAVSLLKERGWIGEDTHRMLDLTEEGRARARHVVRNFGVVECFLQDVLGIPHEVGHADACKMEHLLNPATADALLRLIHLLDADPAMSSQLKNKLQTLGLEDTDAEAT